MIAARAAAIGADISGFRWNAGCHTVSRQRPLAADAAVPGQYTESEIGQRIADGGQFPIQHRGQARFGGMDDHIAQFEIAMDDGGSPVRRHTPRQFADQCFHIRDGFGFGRAILLDKAAKLAGDIVPLRRETGETDRGIVHLMQGSQCFAERIVDGTAVFVRQAGQCGIEDDAARHKIHHIKGGADDGIILAKEMHTGNGNRRIAQCLHDAEFTIHLMGAGQQRAGRFLAHDELRRAIPHAGRKQECGIGRAALKLLHHQIAVIIGEMGGKTITQPRNIEAMCRRDLAHRQAV